MGRDCGLIGWVMGCHTPREKAKGNRADRHQDARRKGGTEPFPSLLFLFEIEIPNANIIEIRKKTGSSHCDDALLSTELPR